MIITIDNETYQIGPTTPFPKVVCVGAAIQEKRDGEIESHFGTTIEGTAKEIWVAALEAVTSSEEVLLVNQHLAFDMITTVLTWPDLMGPMFEALETGRCYCLGLREKLINLSTHGKLNNSKDEMGVVRKVNFSLADMALDYLDLDLSGEKDKDDAWRMHFGMLAEHRWDDYPEDAKAYLQGDVEIPIHVYWAQEDKAEEYDASLETQGFQTLADFSLKLFSMNMLHVDQARALQSKAEIEDELNGEFLRPLIEAGILTPAVPAVPHANGAIDKDTGLPKMKAAQKSKVKTKALRGHVVAASQRAGIEVRLTEKGSVETSKGVIDELITELGGDLILETYARRQKLQKTLTTYLPPLMAHDRVYAGYDVLKETGRTSSGKSKLMPNSWNGQNVDPKIRPACLPRPGFLLCSVDYSANELVSLAQTCIRLFGKSVMADQINAGRDLHAYLGAQIALEKWPEFRQECIDVDVEDRTEVYDRFLKRKADPLFKHFRTLAKPVGLGYPGGLGARTLAKHAKEAYGVQITIEEAQELKEMWLQVYPEMVMYFEHVNNVLPDPHNQDCYAYTSPFGMVRRGASYCAAANGIGLQTPTAEGGKVACYLVANACYRDRKSVLYGRCHPALFIHDEIVCEVANDSREERHAIAQEIARLMTEGMRSVITDVKVSAEPVFMDRWYKQAEPVFGKDGLLDVWQPKEK